MSREVRRVPAGFDWPIRKVWHGYLMPDHLNLPACPDCKHGGNHPTGYSREANAIAETFYAHQITNGFAMGIAAEHAERLAWHDKIGQDEVDMLVAAGCLRHLTRREPTEDNPSTREWVSVPRSAEDVNQANRTPYRDRTNEQREMDHDTSNHHLLVRFRCEKLGIPLLCPTCDGEGHVATPQQKQANEAWEATEPPTGDCWQLWETVSEGSPISPVFPDAEDLAQWMTTPAAGRDQTTIDIARKFVSAGWAPSLAVSGGRLMTGIEATGTERP